MAAQPEDERLRALLRRGLREISASEPTAQFNARIVAALERPTPGWATLFAASRTMLAPALCSLLLSLALLSRYGGPAGHAEPNRNMTSTNGASLRRVEQALDKIDSGSPARGVIIGDIEVGATEHSGPAPPAPRSRPRIRSGDGQRLAAPLWRA